MKEYALMSVPIEPVIVVRQYSGVTRNKVLWQVCSRPLRTLGSVDSMVDDAKDRYPNSKVFLVRVVDFEAIEAEAYKAYSEQEEI